MSPGGRLASQTESTAIQVCVRTGSEDPELLHADLMRTGTLMPPSRLATQSGFGFCRTQMQLDMPGVPVFAT